MEKSFAAPFYVEPAHCEFARRTAARSAAAISIIAAQWPHQLQSA
jgi:hypothetical protein